MTEILLREQDRIDDLQRNGLRIISNPQKFCFGTDAVLLAAFAKLRRCDRVADLGTGNGILCFLIGARYPDATFDAIELQSEVADLAQRSVCLNEWESKMRVHCMDLKDAPAALGHGAFDVVVTNPPYGEMGRGILPPEDAKATARFEVNTTLADVFRSGSALLRNGGHMFMVNRPDRLMQMLDACRQFHLTPARVRFMHSYADREAKLVFLECIKNSTCQIRWQAPLILFDSVGVYSREAKEIYNITEELS